MIKIFQSREKFITVLLILIITVFYCFPILRSFNNWGAMDWDEVFFWGGTAREAILKYHQLPLWNPYAQNEGVLVAAAYPNSFFFSPFFLFILLLGPVYGSKIILLIHFALGFAGMKMLSQSMGTNLPGAFFAAVIYMCSSVFALHLAEGHYEWLAMAFLPWLFMYFLKSQENIKYLTLSILFMALMLLGGSVDVFLVTVLLLILFSIFEALRKWNTKHLANVMLLFTVTFLLCSFKLFPVIEYLSLSSREQVSEQVQSTPVKLLPAVLFDTRQSEFYSSTKWHGPGHNYKAGNDLNISYGWHEYGAYTGVIPFIFLLLGIAVWSRKYWPLFITAVIMLLIVLGHSLPVWGWLQLLPVFNSMRVPSRFILGFIFALSLFAGAGFSFAWQRPNKIVKAVVPFLLIFLLWDLNSINNPVWEQAFPVTPPRTIERGDFKQHKNFTWDTVRLTRSNRYQAFLENKGVLHKIYNDMATPSADLRAIEDKNYLGEAYLYNSKKTVIIENFSPNEIKLSLTADAEDVLVLNQKFYPGWLVRDGSFKTEAIGWEGLIAFQIKPGYHEISFHFMPKSFIYGMITSLFTVLFLLLLAWQNKKSLLKG